MKAAPIIIAVVAVVAIVRLALRRRGGGWSSPSGRLARRVAGRLRGRMQRRRVLGDIGLVVGREVRERVRGRVFRVVTLILFVAVAAAVVIPTIHSGTAKSHRVGVVSGSVSLDAELGALATRVGLSVELVKQPDLAAARAALSAGRLDLVVDSSAEAILVSNPISASDSSAQARYVEAVATTLGAQRAFARAGLSTQQATIVAQAKPLPVQSLHPAKASRTSAESTSLIGVILIFIVLTQYLTWTLMGVMEEKASRVVEVLLATLRPIQLLAGKVIGIGAVALLQAGVLVAFALALGAAVGSTLVQGAAPLVVVSVLVWLVLGYAFYSWLYAAAGSMAERQDQVQSMALPLSAPLILGYIVSLVGASSGEPSLLIKILAYLPPTAPFAMPTLVGFGRAAWWQFLLSVLLSLACTLGVAVVASRVYRTAVLRTGGRVRLRDLVPTLSR